MTASQTKSHLFHSFARAGAMLYRTTKAGVPSNVPLMALFCLLTREHSWLNSCLWYEQLADVVLGEEGLQGAVVLKHLRTALEGHADAMTPHEADDTLGLFTPGGLKYLEEWCPDAVKHLRTGASLNTEGCY